MITTLILTKNHENIIASTLESIKDLGPILVADLGSKDATVSICEKYGAKVFKIPFNHDYSTVRNTIASKVTTDWLFWIEPGEEIVSGKDLLLLEKSDSMYRVMVVRDDLLMKEPRMVRKDSINCRYVRPVFEGLEKDCSEQTLPVVISGETRPDVETMMECLVRWKDKEPFSPEPDYYTACLHLMCGRNEQFLSIADQFLFMKSTMDASTVFIRYYVAMLLKRKNVGKALQLMLECIATYPLMAEFWCLLGDLYLITIREYDRAYLFYENAIILGSQRLAEDTMPMEISKYDEYPHKMMDIIKTAIKKTVIG
jgi:glycosyltransferase involved in cell wall biosynthesis